MKILTVSQIREVDAYTIQHEPISPIGLMERAANAITAELLALYPCNNTSFVVFAGPGNNGGDGLAVARLLLNKGYPVDTVLVHHGNLSDECNENLNRLLLHYPHNIVTCTEVSQLPPINRSALIIDALFGSGLHKPLSGLFAGVVQHINYSGNKVIAIDTPSGLQTDTYHRLTEIAVKASLTLTLQFPKKSFFFAENEAYVGRWRCLDIGLHPESIGKAETAFFYQEKKDMRCLVMKRSRFAHKGTVGHLALLAGSKGMAGASILASEAALRSGVGSVTLHGPEGNRTILQTTVPEVMYDTDKHPDCISEFYHALKYDAVAIGPGIGTRTPTVEMLRILLQQLKNPCVLDADALNILAQQRNLLPFVPHHSILTPHPKEFDRLFGESINSYVRLEKAQAMAAHLNVIIVLKGAYTQIVTPDKMVYFNSSGNSGMATAGSGDVLTGIIGSLLAQGYEPEIAARLGVYLHGLSADLAMEQQSEESLLARDIAHGLGKAFKHLCDNL